MKEGLHRGRNHDRIKNRDKLQEKQFIPYYCICRKVLNKRGLNGMMKKGIKEVAKEAGVSPTTVSRVLNNRGYISEQTRQKVYDAMEQIDYHPNELARALLKNRSYLVGVIMPTITSPFHGEVTQYVEAYLSQSNYKTLLCNSQNRVDTEMEYIDMLRRNQVDGIIVGTHNNIMDEYKDIQLPVVAIDRYIKEDGITVSCDNYSVGKLATEHLIQRGCKNILCIRGNSKLRMPGNERSRAYRETMKRYGLEPIVLEAEFGKESKEKKKIIEDMLMKNPKIDGVFAGDDILASLVLQIAKENGICVPKDLKVIGVDGTKATLTFVPELTTIQQPIEEIARVAADTLIRWMNGETVASQTNLPVQLIQGITT